MAINFPNSPAINDLYTFDGRTWIWNGYGWDAVAIGLPTTPGGSTTQIQYNNAGAFGGDAALVWTSATGTLDVTATNGGLVVRNPDTSILFFVHTDGANKSVSYDCSGASGAASVNITSGSVSFDGGGSLTSFGDANANWYGTGLWIDDPNTIMYLGDRYGVTNGTLYTIDVANSKTTSNVKHEGSNASGTFFDGTGTITLGDYSAAGAGSFLSITDSSQTFDLKANTTIRLKNYGGTVSIGDVDSDVNSTRVVVDDPNSRIELNAAKPVIGNTTGNGQYIYDSGTATYWQWQSVNGVWTGTDTTSGSLP